MGSLDPPYYLSASLGIIQLGFFVAFVVVCIFGPHLAVLRAFPLFYTQELLLEDLG